MTHRIEPGQTYISLGDPYPYTEPRRIKVVGEPGRLPGGQPRRTGYALEQP